MPAKLTFIGAGTFDGQDELGGDIDLDVNEPSGVADGDLLVIFVYGSTTTRTINSNGPASLGWTTLIDAVGSQGWIGMWFIVRSGSEAITNINVTVDADSEVYGQMAAWRFQDTPGSDVTAGSTWASTQNIGAIAATGVTPLGSGDLVIVAGGKKDTSTSMAVLSGDGLTWNEIGEGRGAGGTVDGSCVWDYAISQAGGNTTLTSKTFTVTGGAAAVGRGVMATFLGPDLKSLHPTHSRPRGMRNQTIRRGVRKVVTL